MKNFTKHLVARLKNWINGEANQTGNKTFLGDYAYWRKEMKKMYAVWHKFKGYLSDNGQRLYYSETITGDTLAFDTEMEANLLCDTYEKPVKVNE